MNLNSQTNRPQLYVILGPTASGKTRLAVQLANEFALDIVSADSRQVYKGLDLGSGKDLSEYQIAGKKIPHHLIDIEAPQKIYSLYNYQQDCYQTLTQIFQKKKAAIMCGGSGLYLESVLRNYQIPEVPEQPEFRERQMLRDKKELEKELHSLNPLLHSQTDLSSKKRIVRALEIHFFKTDFPDKKIIPPPFHFHIYWLQPPKSLLHSNIQSRIQSRLELGMIKEVEALLENGLSFARMQQLGLEYQLISRHLMGEINLDQLNTELYLRIRKFSKSQNTYFRGMERRGLSLQPIWGENCRLLWKHINFTLS